MKYNQKMSGDQIRKATQKMEDCYFDATGLCEEGDCDEDSLFFDLNCKGCSWIEICDIVKEAIADYRHTKRRFSTPFKE